MENLNLVAQVCVELEIDGVKVGFPRTEVSDLGKFGQWINEERSKNCKQRIAELNMEFAGKQRPIDVFQLNSLLTDIDNSFPTMQDMWVKLQTPQGAKLIVEYSLAKTNYSAEQKAKVFSELTVFELVELAKLLTSSRTIKKVEDKVEPNPLVLPSNPNTIPKTYGDSTGVVPPALPGTYEDVKK